MPRESKLASTFRTSVEQRLRNYARSVGVPVFVVRRQAGLERLMARLIVVAPDRWALKGGLALDTRLGDRARASMDMDIDHAQGAKASREDLAGACNLDMGDHFSFNISGSTEFQEGGTQLAVSYRVDSGLAGAPFETLHVDITLDAPGAWEVVYARRPGLLAAVGLGPIEVPLVPLERQISEKLHAYTRTYGTGKPSTRVRDLVDLVLIRLLARVDADKLRVAVTQTFSARKTHGVPTQVPKPPASWRVPYHEEAVKVGTPLDLADAYTLVASWLDVVLIGMAHGMWDPVRGVWESPATSARSKQDEQ